MTSTRGVGGLGGVLTGLDVVTGLKALPGVVERRAHVEESRRRGRALGGNLTPTTETRTPSPGIGSPASQELRRGTIGLSTEMVENRAIWSNS